MATRRIVFSSAATATTKVYAEVPTSYELVGATVVQNGASVGASGSNYKTLTIGNNSDSTIATVNTVAGWTQGTPVDFTLSNPENAILTAGQRFSIIASHTGTGAEVECAVSLDLQPARSY